MSDLFATNPFLVTCEKNKHSMRKTTPIRDNFSTIAPINSDVLWKHYNQFMNNSDIFIVRDYKTFVIKEGYTQYHVIPSKGDAILLVAIDMSAEMRVDWLSEELSSFQFKNYSTLAKKLRNARGMNLYIFQDDHNYYMGDGSNETIVPKVHADDLDDYLYCLDIYNETYIELFNCHNEEYRENYDSTNPKTPSSDFCDIQNNVLNAINGEKPIDFLIKKNNFLAFQQGETTVKSDFARILDYFTILRSDATVILRSHNFLPFKKQDDMKTVTRILRNGDGEYWLHTKVKSNFNKIPDIQFYEHLERVR